MNPNSILYIFLSWLISMCYEFVLLSSAAGQNSDLSLFEPGSSLHYKLQSVVLMNEHANSSKNVGFYVDGFVQVNTLWGGKIDKILQLKLDDLKLHVKSRKAPSPDGFVPHKSNLDNHQYKSYLVIIKNNKIDKLLMPKNVPLSILNLQKGIASLLQFQMLKGETKEIDSSGVCLTKYTAKSDDIYIKEKLNCVSADLPYAYNPEKVLKTTVKSNRITEYHLDLQKNAIKSIHSKETHRMFLSVKDDIGNLVEAEQHLTLVKEDKTNTIEGVTVDSALQDYITKQPESYTLESLLSDRETDSEETIFSDLVDEFRNQLDKKAIGTLSSARSFIKLINIGRMAKKSDIQKAITSKKNKDILLQLYDILGYIQTKDSHEAAIGYLNFDDKKMLDLSERYLWALSICSKPNPDIIMELFDRFNKKPNMPDKVKETIVLTIASMAYRLRQLKEQDNYTKKVIRDVEEAILNNLDYAKGEDKYQYFRALKNVKSAKAIPKLLEYIEKGTPKEGALSWKVIKAIPKEHWDDKVLKSARRTFFQLIKKHDQSSRTLAAEVMLDSDINEQNLKDILDYLKSNDTAFEIKQYVYQIIKMKLEECPKFRKVVLSIIKRDPSLNNYSTLTPRGMSTVLSRNLFTSDCSNGSLVSMQELKSGIVKRGSVNIVMRKNHDVKEIISLGLFSGGLSSFMSSSSNENELEDDESVNAGLELAVLGTQLRPFVFFDGQGELMGHVWSGTASEKTMAYQANTHIQDHLEYIRLGNGFIAELNVKGALSYDLSGFVKISIFYSTANSLVEQMASVVVMGRTKIDTSFVKSKVEFFASIEPQLNLYSDLEFSGKLAACMRLTQQDFLYTHNIIKTEGIPDSKHKLRIARYKKFNIPGITYLLNRKNNEVCSAMFYD